MKNDVRKAIRSTREGTLYYDREELFKLDVVKKRFEKLEKIFGSAQEPKSK